VNVIRELYINAKSDFPKIDQKQRQLRRGWVIFKSSGEKSERQERVLVGLAKSQWQGWITQISMKRPLLESLN
jgi:hypothetical protein